MQLYTAESLTTMQRDCVAPHKQEAASTSAQLTERLQAASFIWVQLLLKFRAKQRLCCVLICFFFSTNKFKTRVFFLSSVVAASIGRVKAVTPRSQEKHLPCASSQLKDSTISPPAFNSGNKTILVGDATRGLLHSNSLQLDSCSNSSPGKN